MTQAETEIADLDYSLAADGQTITLTRGAASVDCAAFVRGLQGDALVDTVRQQEFTVIISPTQIAAEVWPSAPDSPPPSVDASIPAKGDKVSIAGRQYTVQSALPIFIADTLVRINLKVKG